MNVTVKLIAMMSIAALICPRESRGESVPADEIRAAISRSVTFLQNDMRQWREVRKCGACHHAPPALVALRQAAEAGIASDGADYADLRKWTIEDDRARLIPKSGNDSSEPPSLALQSVYLAWALAGDHGADGMLASARSRVGAHLQQTQAEDGHWTGPAGHPPVFASPTEITLMAVLAARQSSGEPLLPTPSIERAEEWIRQQPLGESQQELALRVMWAAQTGRAENLKIWTDRLLARQQPDGGWRQTSDLSSDAFATGQTIVALATAGLKSDDAALQRAARFLIDSQIDGGTWTMISRPDPKDGLPAENLNPITYVGTAWATRGLITLLK